MARLPAGATVYSDKAPYFVFRFKSTSLQSQRYIAKFDRLPTGIQPNTSLPLANFVPLASTTMPEKSCSAVNGLPDIKLGNNFMSLYPLYNVFSKNSLERGWVFTQGSTLLLAL